MSNDVVGLDPDLICRDETCERLEIHRKHLVAPLRRVRVHHRPKPAPKPGATPVWERDSRKGLTAAVAKATSKSHPRVFSDIVREVQNDYGSVTTRTIHRYLDKLIKRGQVIRVELGLPFVAYLRPRSKLIGDVAAIKEYLLGLHDVFNLKAQP